MPRCNLLFFLNAYNDLCQTSTPALSNFQWSRQINGVPYTYENNQQIQVLPGVTTSNIIPYPFSSPTNTGSYSVNSTTTMTVSGSTAGISPGSLIVGSPIPLDTTVVSLGVSQYTFTITSANATTGAVYSNNSQNFTVSSTIVAGTTLACTGTGTGVPTASGTLTLVSGTGDATIAFSAFAESTPILMSRAATSTTTTSISFYSPASFIYMESDQDISVIYNNGTAMAINPFQINGSTVPGVFFMNGPAYSLTVTNFSSVAANIFFASMG